MKKPKLNINFGEGGFQGWLVRHCEKIILGMVVLLALFMISRGYSLAGLGSDASPDKLKTTASDKRTQITSTRWDVFSKDRQVAIDTAIKTAKMKDVKVDSINYELLGYLNRPEFARLGKRTDPKIFEPINLKPVPMVTSLAYVAPLGYDDPLGQIADEPGKKPVRRPPPKPKGGGGAAAGGMEAGAIPGAAGGGRPKRGKAAQSPMGDGMDLLVDGGEEMGGGAMPGMGGMEGMGGMGGGAAPTSDMLFGQYRPPSGSMLKTKHAVVLMAIVQNKKQSEEYDKVFSQALDPNLYRDQPTYRTFRVRRADVTADPSADPATVEWKDVNPKVLLTDWAKWAGTPQDILDPAYLEYVDYNTGVGLTYPLPPFVQRDLWETMTHPDIPLASGSMQAPIGEHPAEETAPAEEGTDAVPGRRVPGGGLRRPGGMAPGGGMMPGAGMTPGAGMMPGAGMPGAAMPGGARPGPAMPGGAAGMPGMPGAPGSDDGGGAGTPGAGMMGGMGGMGMGGMGMGMGGMGMGMPGMGMPGMNAPQVKYKLIRFIDLTVEPGHKYRYQVQVLLDDPNNPELSEPPKPAALATEVSTRVNKDPDKTWLESPWSAPSDVVSLTSTQWFYAGKVTPDSGKEEVKGTRPVRQREAAATALAVVHDATKGVDVPVVFDVIDQKDLRVIRGSTLNFKTDAEVVHPIAGDFRKLKDYVLQTDAVVADILGGDDIQTLDSKVREEKMTVPGELLIIDADGNLLVQDESEDVEEFRRFVRPQEDKPKAGAAEAAPGGFAPMEEGAVPGAIPGGAGGRRRKGM